MLVYRPGSRHRCNSKKQQKRGKPLLKPEGSDSPRQTKDQAGVDERATSWRCKKDGADKLFQGTRRWFLKPENEKKKKAADGCGGGEERRAAGKCGVDLRLKVEMGAAGR